MFVYGCALVCLWRSENKFGSLHHVGPGVQAQFIRFVDSYLYPTSYLAGPFAGFILMLILNHDISLKMFICSESFLVEFLEYP